MKITAAEHLRQNRSFFTSFHGHKSVISLIFPKSDQGTTPKSIHAKQGLNHSNKTVGLAASINQLDDKLNRDSASSTNYKFPTMMTLPPDISAMRTKTVAFEVGRISHYHNPAEREEIDLTVTLQFDHPVLDRRVFTFSLESRNNHSGRDTMFIKRNAMSRCCCDFNGRVFAMRLLGFGKDPKNLTLSTQMHQVTHNTETIYAEFVDITDPQDTFPITLAVPFTVLGLIAVQKPH
ncbi:hypothetical protein JD969_08840 [Planctomycetota bacterium]|nr:hypothetical protein JD969_08840 [Planctomycetota bacterium]